MRDGEDDLINIILQSQIIIFIIYFILSELQHKRVIGEELFNNILLVNE